MHWLARNASKNFNDFFIQNWNEFYIPLLKKHKVKNIIQLGDMFDDRRKVNTHILDECKQKHFSVMEKEGFQYHVLIGNHDIYWRESLDVNTPSLVLNEYKNISVYSKPTTIEFDGTTIDMIPWICKENEEEVFEFIRKSKSDICAGHFELSGFSMYKGFEAKTGLSQNIFEKFERTWSGHYHTRTTQGNITYVGVPYEMTWQDYNDPKGIHIFDTETRELKFYPTPFTIHEKIEYDDTRDRNFNYDHLKGKYVRVIVAEKNDLVKYDAFTARLNSIGCLDIKYIESNQILHKTELDDEIRVDDTLSIGLNYIDKSDTDLNKDNIKKYFETLFMEAVSLTE